MVEEDSKLPLKRIEFSLSKFNEVAIPHHLDLLRQHKLNILKFEAAGEDARVRTEQQRARRVTSQLRALLRELEGLRAQVRVSDLARFDQLTRRARDDTLAAVQDYLETSPLPIQRREDDQPAVSSSALSTDSVGVVRHDPGADAAFGYETSGAYGASGNDGEIRDEEQLQMQLEEQERILHSRTATLHGWRALHAELRDLRAAWAALHAAARAQATPLARAEGGVEGAAADVVQGRRNLAAAERLSLGALTMGAGGALAGLAVGGPAGLLLGGKAGALAAGMLASVAGGLAATALGRRRQEQLSEPQEDKDKDKDKNQ